MERILDQNIKELITSYPSIESALNDFKISCTTCGSGTCRLRDIIEIHRLSTDDEYKLFKNIADIVYPGQNVEIPRLPRKNTGKKTLNKFSPPVKMLVDEHTIIKKVIGSFPILIESANADFEHERARLRDVLNFFRFYADKFHHAKEEDLLFKLFDLQTDIIVTMYKEHEIGRTYIRNALTALDAEDLQSISENLKAYAVLLIDHIRKEDEILYPWMDNFLTDKQIGTLYSKFISIGKKEESKMVNTILQIIGR